MNVFVNKNAEIVVTIFTYQDPSGKISAWTKNLPEMQPKEVDSTLVSKNEVVFKVPGYKENSELLDSAVEFDQSGKMRIVSSALTFNRFTKLLKRWDFKDQDGAIVPANSENVALLETVVAQIIARDLEAQLVSQSA